MLQFNDKEMVVDGTNVMKAGPGFYHLTRHEERPVLNNVGRKHFRIQVLWSGRSWPAKESNSDKCRCWRQETEGCPKYWNSPHHAESLGIP